MKVLYYSTMEKFDKQVTLQNIMKFKNMANLKITLQYS